MLQQKSKIKEIEYHIQQVEMLSMNPEEEEKISKIIALQGLIENDAVKELIAEDLKDESWLEATQILIKTCNKRMLKSEVLREHVKQCKNFMVFRYIEDKLLYSKEVIVTNKPWNFQEVNTNNEKSEWINSKFTKAFMDSEIPLVLEELMKNELTISTEWLYKNKCYFFSEDIFEDIDFLIKKKKKN